MVTGPSFITVPKNTEHGFEHQTDMKGWIISLCDPMLEHMIKREINVINAIEAFQVTRVIPNTAAEALFEDMLACVEEYAHENIGKLLMLEYIIGKIIVQLSRLPKDAQQWIFNKDNSSVLYSCIGNGFIRPCAHEF